MSPIATLVVVALVALLWFGVVRPRLRGTDSRRDAADGGDFGHGDSPRHHDDADGSDGGDGGGGDGGGGD